MCKIRLIAAVLALMVLCSCGSGGVQRDAEDLPDLLSAVPSDALAVLSSSSCAGALLQLDSADVLRSLNLDAFGSAPAVLSLGYNGSSVPTLVVGTGVQDSTSAVTAAIRQAKRKGVQAEYFAPDTDSGRQGLLAFTPSESQMVALRRHIGEGRSIFDAPLFREAASLTEGADFIILRNSGASHLMPEGFLSDVFPRRSLAAFLHRAADWTVLQPSGEGGFSVRTVQGEEDTYFVNILASLPFADSRLGEILPEGTDFALALPLPEGTFRDAYENYVDASVKMTSYRRRLASLKAVSGKDPLLWEKELGVREVAMLRWNGRTAVLLRPSKPLKDSAVEDNPHRGFVPALYGEAFSLKDDSCRGELCGWYAIGSREAVEALREAVVEKHKDSAWPGKNCHFVLYDSGRTAVWNRKGITIWNSSL